MQGQQDSPLTEKGISQARRQGEILRLLPEMPRKILVSPLGRTLHTARLALGDNAEWSIDDRLKEIGYGEWEGQTKEAVKAAVPSDLKGSGWQFNSPGGETFDDLSARVSGFLREMDEPAVIITHGMTSIVMRGLLTGLDRRGMLALPRDQGCVYHLSNGTETILR